MTRVRAHRRRGTKGVKAHNRSGAGYQVIVDYGKPYEENPSNKGELFQLLYELRLLYESMQDDVAFFDVSIYKNGKDVTGKIYKEFDKRNR